MAERAVFAGIVAVAAWVDCPSGVPCGETIPMEQRRPGDAAANSDDMLARFENWTAAYGKSYVTAEEKRHRFDVYAVNLRHIDRTNAGAEAAGLTYTLGENGFSDLMEEEFRALFLSHTHLLLTEDDDGDVSINMTSAAPPTIDWRQRGAVTPVKNQGNVYGMIFRPSLPTACCRISFRE
jgi:hypothetical protein